LARRRNDKGSGILLLIAIVVAAVAVIGPFVIALWAIVAELNAKRFRFANRASQLISPNEKAKLVQCEAQIFQIDQQASAILHSGLARGLPTRSDGLFDARNSEGREFNYRLEALSDDRARWVESRDALKDQLAERQDGWLKARAGVVGTRVGLVAFVSIFTLMTASRLSEHGLTLTMPLLMFGSGTDGADRILASGVATVAAGLALWMARSFARTALA
jgi:hypothetical protein